jgi:hypothetical protein
MSDVIRDPVNKTGARVNSMGELTVAAITETAERFANKDNGQAYSINVEQTPTGGNDNFLYIKNTSSSDQLIIEGVDNYAGSAEEVLIFLGTTGTTIGGTAVTPANLNTSSSKEMTGTFEAGNNITGLTDGTQIYKIKLGTSQSQFNFEQDIVIAPGGVLSMQAVTGGIKINMNVLIHIDPKIEVVN